ncbi:hypothetical protein GLOIN_2v1838491 [Rhizophagus clarus]|uniref:Uncharacterized protein n=1 Tax=Rhizophagus clarus TaxID=94130 RepID=A0A8H3R4J0_9GLOM|nr:hypothetical protein GLOIN_2v1838491 [Rhizophagus clarus]
MWCSRVCYPFKKLLEYNPKYFSKNGFIQMVERVYIDGNFKAGRHSLYIYCTVCNSLVIIHKNTIEYVNDYLKKCIAKRPEIWVKQVWNMMKNDSTPDEKKFLTGINYENRIQAKDMPAYYQNLPILFDHYSSYKWVEKKKEQF